MVDASEGQVLMAVYHDPNNTNLYLSEEAGLNYSLSLQHIISPPEYDWIDSYVKPVKLVFYNKPFLSQQLSYI